MYDDACVFSTCERERERDVMMMVMMMRRRRRSRRRMMMMTTMKTINK